MCPLPLIQSVTVVLPLIVLTLHVHLCTSYFQLAGSGPPTAVVALYHPPPPLPILYQRAIPAHLFVTFPANDG